MVQRILNQKYRVCQGEEQQTLVWLKAIFKRLLLLKYNWKFEKGFILNEYGWIKQQYEEGIYQ